MKFVKLYSGAPDVEKADSSARGTLPSRAMQYCEPVAAASRLGWYVFPPVSFSLLWTGNEVLFKIEEAADWVMLDRYFHPAFTEEYEKHSSIRDRRFAPSFLDLFTEGNIVQIWSGYAVQGVEGYCSFIRSPINTPQNKAYEHYEAIIDTSWHTSPLLTNIKIKKQDVPIYFPRHQPLVQVVPLPVEMLSKKYGLDSDIVLMPEADASFWDAWHDTFLRRNSDGIGTYAAKQRKRNNDY